MVQNWQDCNTHLDCWCEALKWGQRELVPASSFCVSDSRAEGTGWRQNQGSRLSGQSFFVPRPARDARRVAIVSNVAIGFYPRSLQMLNPIWLEIFSRNSHLFDTWAFAIVMSPVCNHYVFPWIVSEYWRNLRFHQSLVATRYDRRHRPRRRGPLAKLRIVSLPHHLSSSRATGGYSASPRTYLSRQKERRV